MKKNWQGYLVLIVPTIILVLVLGFGDVTSAAAVNSIYYVDCSAASNGTGSQASPWNNLTTVNGTTFGGNDQILFKRGTTCVGQLWPKGSGASGSPVTISSYGTGAKPILDGNNAAVPVVYLKNQNYWTITGLEIRNSANKGLYVDANAGTDVYGFTITDIYVHNSGLGDGSPLMAFGSFAGHSVHDVLIDNVQADTGWRGIEVGGKAINTPSARSTNITIRNVTVSNVQNDGIIVATSNNVLIENSVAFNTGLMPTLINHTPNSIWTWDTDNAVVQGTEAYGSDTPPGQKDGGSYDIDYFNSNNIVQYNYGHDNSSYCVAIFGADNSVTVNSIVRYNICSNNTTDATSVNPGDIFMSTWSGGSLNGVQVYNNTSYWNPAVDAPAYISGLGTTYTGSLPTFFKNNILYSTKASLIDLPLNFTLDYNLYWYTGAGQPVFRYGGAFYNGFSAFQYATRQESHGLYTNPLLNTPTYHANGKPTTQFALQSNSPAINSGTDVCAGQTSAFGCAANAYPNTRDFLGSANNQAGAYDRGAVESNSTNAPPNYPAIPNPPAIPTVSPAVPQVAGARAVILSQDENAWYGGRSNTTCRTFQRVSTGGSQIRIKVTNDNSTDPITFTKVYAGIRATGVGPSVRDNVQVTFGGQTSVTLQTNQQIYSDPINLAVQANEDVGASFYVAGAFPTKLGVGWPDDVSPSTYCAEFTNGGDHAADLDGGSFLRPMVDSKGSGAMLFLTAVDVYTNNPTGSIVVIGDSVSAGTGTMGRNGYNRWSEILAYRLQASPRPKPVVNMAVSGDTCEVANSWVASLLARLQRDVTSQSGVSHVIMVIGTNDIYGKSVTATALESCMLNIRNQLHSVNIKLIMGTIIPVSGQPNATRTTVNDWIRSVGYTEFDGFIDLDKAIRDPLDNNKILYSLMPEYDNYHPNAAGHLAIGNSIDLSLFDSVNGPVQSPAQPATWADGQNQLENPSFESVATSPWYKYGTAGVYNNNAHQGSFNIQFNGANAGIALWPTFEKNTVYTFNAWCKAGGSGQIAGLYAKDKDNSVEWDAVQSGTAWQKLEVIFNTGNLATGKLEIGYWQAKGAGETYCDEFSFARTPSATAQTSTGAVIATTKLPVGLNLITNYGFEAGASPWWFSTGSDVVTSPAGNVYAGLTSAKAATGGGFSILVDADSFTTYTLSATCRADDTSQTGNLFAKIKGTSTDLGVAPVTSATWQTLSFTFSTAVNQNVEVGFWRTGGAGNVYCDDFSISVSAVQTALQPGVNILGNPGFETGSFSPWYQWGSAVVNNTNPRSGTYSEQVGANSGAAAWPEVASYTNYTLQAWCKRSDTSQVGTVYVKVRYSGDLATAAVTSTSYQLITLNFNTGSTNTLEVGLWRDTNAGSGNVYCDDFSLAVAADVVPPDTQINTKPSNPVASSTVDFTFSSPDSTATFQCSLDGAAYAACFSPQNLSGLANGSHTFSVRGVDLLGNVDPTPASYTWTVTVDTLLSRTGWTASASIYPGSGVFVLDGIKSATSAWFTGASQAVGQWFQVDMKATKTFNKVILNQEFYTTYYPRNYEVFVSNDGTNWGTAVASGSGTSGDATVIVLNFATQSARYIRVKLTSANSSWWAITEFYVYAP